MAEATKADQKAAEKEAKARTAALDAAKAQIDKQFGAGSLMTLSGQSALEIEAIPTGALSLDLARFEVAHDPSRGGHFDPPRSGHAAQALLELLFERVLAAV